MILTSKIVEGNPADGELYQGTIRDVKMNYERTPESSAADGAGKNAYIATFVDKTSKYLLAKVIPDKAAATLNRAAVRAFKPVPAELVKTLTVDAD